MSPIGYVESMLRLAAVSALSICLSGAAMSADTAPMPRKAIAAPVAVPSPWIFSVTPYFWAPSLNGSATVKGRTTDADVSFVDLLEHTKIPKDLFGLMAFFEARNGRLSLFADVVYMKVGLNASMTRSRGVDALNASVGASAGLKIEMAIAEMAAAYEIARWGSSATPGSGTAIDIFGGARAWWQKGEASLALGGTVNIGDLNLNPNGTLTASGTVGWIDPLFGARLRHQFTPGMNLVVSGDIGGFGVGSKISWQAQAAINYDFYVRNNVTWSGMVGYRALYVDYSRGSGLTHYEYNMTMHGPILGISARF